MLPSTSISDVPRSLRTWSAVLPNANNVFAAFSTSVGSKGVLSEN